jgi:hypothetical protein
MHGSRMHVDDEEKSGTSDLLASIHACIDMIDDARLVA